jgi:hypothetical protein
MGKRKRFSASLEAMLKVIDRQLDNSPPAHGGSYALDGFSDEQLVQVRNFILSFDLSHLAKILAPAVDGRDSFDDDRKDWESARERKWQ